MRALVFALSILAVPALAETVTAVLEPVQFAEIRAARPGRLAEIFVTEGEKVQARAPLAALDSAAQQARVDLADAVAAATGSIDRAKTQLKQALTVKARVDRAAARGAAKEWEVIQAEQAVTLAQADIKIAEDRVSQIRGQFALERAVLKEYERTASFDATVLQVFREVGETVELKDVIMEVGRLSELKATAFAPVSSLDDLKVGTQLPAVVEGPSPSDTEVTVATIDPRVDPASQTVRVTLGLDYSQRRYLAGTTVSVTFP